MKEATAAFRKACTLEPNNNDIKKSFDECKKQWYATLSPAAQKKEDGNEVSRRACECLLWKVHFCVRVLPFQPLDAFLSIFPPSHELLCNGASIGHACAYFVCADILFPLFTLLQFYQLGKINEAIDAYTK